MNDLELLKEKLKDAGIDLEDKKVIEAIGYIKKNVIKRKRAPNVDTPVIFKVLDLYKKGYRQCEIAKELEIDYKVVCGIVKRYKDNPEEYEKRMWRRHLLRHRPGLIIYFMRKYSKRWVHEKMGISPATLYYKFGRLRERTKIEEAMDFFLKGVSFMDLVKAGFNKRTLSEALKRLRERGLLTKK